jgi:hypothetical protein
MTQRRPAFLQRGKKGVTSTRGRAAMMALFSPQLQRRPVATKAMYPMMRRVFDELGCRRYKWKCNSLKSRVSGHRGPARFPV